MAELKRKECTRFKEPGDREAAVETEKGKEGWKMKEKKRGSEEDLINLIIVSKKCKQR